MRILFFDIAITGHHPEYISHLVNYLSDQGTGDKTYSFVVNPEFENQFPTMVAKAKAVEGVEWVQIKQGEFDSLEKAGKLKTYLAEYRLMDLYARKLKADHVCALNFNLIQLGAIFSKPAYTLSGILFLHFYRMNKNTLKEKIQYYKSYFISKNYHRNPQIKTVYLLNDQEVVDETNKLFKTSIFEMLPDPIPQLKPKEGFDVYEEYGLDKDSKIMLHIGSLGNRKSTPEVIEAVQHLSPEDQEKTTLLLVGRASSDEERNAMLQKIEESKANSKATVFWDEQFVPTPVMKSLFDQCDMVLIPYKNVEASSGILGHAAAAQKPVIATGAGLLKELVQKHDLGVLVEYPDAGGIAQGMQEALDFKIKENMGKSFVAKHSPNSFAKQVIHSHIKQKESH